MPYFSGATAPLGAGDGVELATEPGHLSVTHEPAAATQATIGKAAVAGVRHICKEISASIAAAATAQTPISVRLRDGATGAGTILWSMMLSAPANQCASVALTGLSIVGTPNTAMTLEFSGAGVANSQQTVNLSILEVSQ